MASLSVIIPVYNKAPFLRRCFNSILKQTDRDAQVIVIDDGSTDGSSEICDEYKKYGFEIHHTKNHGVSAARNLGIKYAKGEWLTFMDADDSYEPRAFEVMKKFADRDINNIVQFGHYRHLRSYLYPAIRNWGEGVYSYDQVHRQWVAIWNKMYKTEFVRPIKFIKGLQFGEDEMFVIDCLLKNGSLYHAPQNLMHHYFDDKDSLTRKDGLPVYKLDWLITQLEKKRDKVKDPDQKAWIESIIARHLRSSTFTSRNYKKSEGKYDVVYFLKEAEHNEELRYSLRSVEKNLRYRNVVFYGGCPVDLKPDKYFRRPQTEHSKWERVRESIKACCENDEISENFWLFNDDFFVMKPMSENMPPQYNGDLKDRIRIVEEKHGYEIEWTRRLKHLVTTLETAGKGTKNYAVHKPMLINRKKALEVLDKFPDEPMFRALYGNYWKIGGVSKHDMKVRRLTCSTSKIAHWEFISTQDDSFRSGNVGHWIRQAFPHKSRFEV